MRSIIRNQGRSLLFIAPSAIVFSIFMFWPLIRTVYFSFFDWNFISPEMEFVGIKNYITLFKDPITKKVFINTGFYIIVLLILNFILPYIISYVLSAIVKRGHNFYKSALFLPSVISLVVGSILYMWILNPVSGPIGLIAKRFGFNIPIWSKTDGLVIVVISIITSWKVFGYNFLVLFASVSGVPKEVIEAAKIDNLSNFKIFKDIIFPMTSATGVYVFIITIVQGLQQGFIPIKVITQGGPYYASSSLTYHSYHHAFTMFSVGTASALSVITMLLFGVLLFLEFQFVEKKVYYEN